MSPATLRQTFIRKTHDLLMRGVLDRWVVNPFSFMPSSVVQDHLSRLWPAKSELSTASIAPSRLLLTSGRLENVDLPRLEHEEDCVTLLRMLSRGCQNLRTLSSSRVWSIEAERTFQELLPNCAKLEHLHSGIYFHPDDLRNCRNLKSLRLHFGKEETDFFCSRIFSDFLKRHRSLEVFASCHRLDVDAYQDTSHVTSAAVSILDNCPQLISLGFIDSSKALQKLYNTDLKNLRTPRRFYLRRCYWDVARRRWHDPNLSDESEYFERTRVAALSCPMMEVLVIDVLDAGNLRHLKALKNLTSLYINFTDISEVYAEKLSAHLEEKPDVRELYALLEEIGPQLRHLSIHSQFRFTSEKLSLNVVFRNCPNLSTLELDCRFTVEEGVQLSANLRSLERLSVDTGNKNSLNDLISLLSNCPQLKRVLLRTEDFDDGAMQTILQKNPFSELEVASIMGCSLSESGLRRFVQSAVKLKNCYFQSYSLKQDDVAQCVRDVNPSAVFHKYYFNLREDLFPQGIDDSCWL